MQLQFSRKNGKISMPKNLATIFFLIKTKIQPMIFEWNKACPQNFYNCFDSLDIDRACFHSSFFSQILNNVFVVVKISVR